MKRSVLILIALWALSSLQAPASSIDTVFVAAGSSGTQQFSHTFVADYTGQLVIGVSDVIDDIVNSQLVTSEPFAGELNSSLGANIQSTSQYLNTIGQPGTTGELALFDISVAAGETIEFIWEFTTEELGGPYNDFAFVEAQGAFYHVLAQVSEVPLPAAAWLYLSAIIGLIGVKRSEAATKRGANSV